MRDVPGALGLVPIGYGFDVKKEPTGDDVKVDLVVSWD